MHKIQANYICTVKNQTIKNGILVVDKMGKILEIAPQNAYQDEVTNYKGIICPGFINTHCHLELSHLKGHLPEGKGLIEFLKPIQKIRHSFSKSLINSKINEAEKEMIKNGIVAVGDISNDDASFTQKSKENLRYYTFIELIGLFPETAHNNLKRGKLLYQQASQNRGSKASLVPHAPYTASADLLQNIDDFNQQHQGITSIHSQETRAENEMFIDGTGEFIDFYRRLNYDMDALFTPPRLSSLRYILQYLSGKCKTLLVHNTYTTQAEVNFAHEKHPNIYWCFCPNANWYIERQLPDFQIFKKNNQRITIGTDSLGSNYQLCILSELKTITQHDSSIPLADLLQWATLNGAEFLGFDNELGSLEVGKSPGINWIKDIDVTNFKLTSKSKIEKLF